MRQCDLSMRATRTMRWFLNFGTVLLKQAIRIEARPKIESPRSRDGHRDRESIRKTISPFYEGISFRAVTREVWMIDNFIITDKAGQGSAMHRISRQRKYNWHLAIITRSKNFCLIMSLLCRVISLAIFRYDDNSDLQRDYMWIVFSSRQLRITSMHYRKLDGLC